jgi:hypothetical protein
MMSQWPAKFAVAMLGLIAGLFLLDRLGLWMEMRGWIYWRKRQRESTGGGAAAGLLTEFQKLVEPQTEHRIQVMEERRDQAKERKGRGDDVKRKS